MPQNDEIYYTVYCRNCGQICKPERYERPAEDHEIALDGKAYRKDWRSSCCHDQLSEDPVSDQCWQCGATANLIENETFEKWNDLVLCPVCKHDMEADHGPDMETLIARAEAMEDR